MVNMESQRTPANVKSVVESPNLVIESANSITDSTADSAKIGALGKGPVPTRWICSQPTAIVGQLRARIGRF